MARLLPQSQAAWAASATRGLSNNTTLLLFLASVAAVASVIAALCTTHKHRGMMRSENKDRGAPTCPPKEEGRLVSAIGSISSKAMLVTKMISWKKAPEEEAAEATPGDEALWKKSIIMGEKCRPWNFSGQISYDSAGRRLPEKEEDCSA